MRLRRAGRFVLFTMLGLLLISVGAASTVSNSVPATLLGDASQGITANDLKPEECAALNLTAVLFCPPDCTGTNANELILGGPGADNIDGRAGTDCILGGDGDDDIRGGGGRDVCIGGPGDDTFSSCEAEFP